MLYFPDGFDFEMAYQLRTKMKTEKRIIVKEETIDTRLDAMMKTMEKMMEKLTLDNKCTVRDQQPTPKIKNPKFRRL